MTNQPLSILETDKTVETYIGSNYDFMREIFGMPEGDTLPLCVSFKGNPSTASWNCRPWDKDAPDFSNENNNYFTLSTYRPTEKGGYKRQKPYFHALHG